jgi:hypothetical protein
MKNMFMSLAVLVLSVSSFAASNDLYKYDCGTTQLTVRFNDGKYSVRQSYKTEIKGKNHVVTIDSTEESLKALEGQFQDSDLSVDDNVGLETGLPASSIAFTGFHYPHGQMYVTAEGDTNEEGYTLAVEHGLIEGAAIVQAGEVFWSDFSESDVHKLTCKLIK